MKWLLISITLLAVVCLSCTTTTNNTVVGNSLAPTITRFSPDTVWTFDTLKIYGTNFSYDWYNIRVFIDSAQANVTDIEDTMVAVIVPEGARTGFVHVWSYEKTATSAKPVVVEYTFNPHSINDTLPDGASFSIPGTGMNNANSNLRLSVGAVQLHIDSVFPNRIVSHVPLNTPTGVVFYSDSVVAFGNLTNIGTLTVTRPSAWTTLSQIYNYLNVTELHRLYVYTNGTAAIESTWSTAASYAGQHDTNIAGINFGRTTTGLQYSAGPYSIVWDTINQTAQVTFKKGSYIPITAMHSLDTQWSAGQQTLQAPLPVDNNIEFALPGFGYTITEDSTDVQGSPIWYVYTTTQVTSGEYDIVLKH